MKITPLEIRQKTFEKAFRGLDKEEVLAYLNSLSQAWEKLQDENTELKTKLEYASKDIQKLKEVETTLYKTLKTAEDTGNTMVQQASKSAELKVKEAELQAQKILMDAKNKASQIIKNAEENAGEIISGMEEEVRRLEEGFKMLQSNRDDFLMDFRNSINTVLRKLEHLESQTDEYDISGLLKKSRLLTRNYKDAEPDHREEVKAPLKPAKQVIEDVPLEVSNDWKDDEESELTSGFENEDNFEIESETLENEYEVEDLEEESEIDEVLDEEEIAEPTATKRDDNKKIIFTLEDDGTADFAKALDDEEEEPNPPKKGKSFFDEI
jgi:cell division initiation protein